MKRLIFLIAFNIYLQGVFSQIDTRFFQKGDALRESPLLKSIHSGKIIMKTLPRFDVEALLKEDRELNGMDIPYRFGKGFDVSYTLDDGEWHDVEDGRIWTMTFAAEGAYSLNFVFSDFHLPKHAKLFIVDKDETVLYGPVTESVIPENAILLSDVIPGSEVTVFLYEPKESAGTSSLCIKRVVHGYRSVESQTAYGAFGASSPCNIDVACKPEWKQESNAVGLVLLANATEWCSGSVLLSTNFAYKPYFLTAFHCIDYSPNDGVLSSTEIEEAENWLFKFNYKKVACGSNALASSKTYSGATLKAAWNKTDFALLKIDSDVSTNDSLAWLGWDRSAGSFYQGAGIHHPCGDVMKVSIEDNLITTIDWNYSQEFNHWLVNWDEGIYEGGSSGSPLLNSSHRVIGQLRGGPRFPYK